MSPDSLQSLIAQTYLRDFGFYHGALDGVWGPVSRKAALDWCMRPGNITIGTDAFNRAYIAQLALAKLGLYRGALDGVWGPISRAAADAWYGARLPAAKPLPTDDRRHSLPYDVAKQYIGVREIPGKADNPIIVRWLRALATWISDDETAWCSAFVNHCAREAGYESTGKLNARSWLDVGETIPLSAARIGDVVILWRVSRNSWQGHVAFLDHHNAKRGLLYLLGGNQNDSVNITAYPVERLLGIRRLRSLDRLQGGTGNRVV